ncbi:MAG: hypothetical protein R3B89_27685 [Polyangiaceae bacterium]
MTSPLSAFLGFRLPPLRVVAKLQRSSMAVGVKTVRQVRQRIVLACGIEGPRLRLCRAAALRALNGHIEECAVEQLTTAAATLRPWAIVMSETTYAFDPQEFDALARDVGGRIVRLPDFEAPMDELEAWLNERFRDLVEDGETDSH